MQLGEHLNRSPWRVLHKSSDVSLCQHFSAFSHRQLWNYFTREGGFLFSPTVLEITAPCFGAAILSMGRFVLTHFISLYHISVQSDFSWTVAFCWALCSSEQLLLYALVLQMVSALWFQDSDELFFFLLVNLYGVNLASATKKTFTNLTWTFELSLIQITT